MSSSAIGSVAAALREMAVASGVASAARDMEARSRTLLDLDSRLDELEALLTKLETTVKERKATRPEVPKPPVEPLPSGPESKRPDHGIYVPKPPTLALPPNWRLADVCVEHGLEVIDRRGVPGGSLWVIGSRDVAQPLFKMLATEGVAFSFVPGGSRATGRRPGWFTKSQR